MRKRVYKVSVYHLSKGNNTLKDGTEHAWKSHASREMVIVTSGSVHEAYWEAVRLIKAQLQESLLDPESDPNSFYAKRDAEAFAFRLDDASLLYEGEAYLAPEAKLEPPKKSKVLEMQQVGRAIRAKASRKPKKGQKK